MGMMRLLLLQLIIFCDNYFISKMILCVSKTTKRTVYHAYDLNKKYPSKCYDNKTHELLPNYQWKNKVISREKINKYKLWPDLISKFDFLHGETLYGLEEAIEAIYKHQHPPDCSKAKFLTNRGWEEGFGSELHVTGVGLATAMNLNRIYIMHPHQKYDGPNRWQVDNPFCHKQGKGKHSGRGGGGVMNLDCYYEPWTNCTIEDAIGANRQMNEVIFSNHSYLIPEAKKIYKDKYKDEKILMADLDSSYDWDHPVIFNDLRDCSPFHIDKLKYWWRAVSITYLMRLNEPTKQLIQHFKTNESSSMYFDKEKEQCVSVYIRRGDKHLEMYILKNETVFFETAKQLWNDNQMQQQQPQQQQPIMFIASEDAGVLDSAIEWGKMNNWKVLYTNLFDRRQVIAGLNATEREVWISNHPNHRQQHHHLEYFSMILSLDSHLQCDAFVCSMPSNFCRLIDELKATVGAKTNTPLADFHDGTTTPCFTGGCITVGW